MKNITINSKTYGEDEPLRLNNGTLILLTLNESVEEAFIVTSYRNSQGHYTNSATNSYCSLVNLDTGYIAFEEHCSRNTSVIGVLNHLVRNLTENNAFKKGYRVKVFPVGNYKIDLKI